MEQFATDRDRLAFLLETDAALDLDFEALEDRAGELVTEELPPDKRPKYITNYIGLKQKLVDWIWKHTPEGVSSAAEAAKKMVMKRVARGEFEFEENLRVSFDRTPLPAFTNLSQNAESRFVIPHLNEDTKTAGTRLVTRTESTS